LKSAKSEVECGKAYFICMKLDFYNALPQQGSSELLDAALSYSLHCFSVCSRNLL